MDRWFRDIHPEFPREKQFSRERGKRRFYLQGEITFSPLRRVARGTEQYGVRIRCRR